VLTVSALLVAAGLLAIAIARAQLPALAGAFLLGFGGGGLNTSANALVSDLYPDKRGAMLNLLGVFFGFGALFIPLLTALILAYVGPVQLLWISAALVGACFVAYVLLRFPPAQEHASFTPLGVLRAAKHPGVLLLAAMLFCQSGNESSIGGWTSTYLGSTGASPRIATWVLAGYWAALMLGRVLSAKLLGSMQKTTLIVAGGIGSIAGAAVLLVSTSIAAMAAGAVLIGVSYAGIYPTVLAIAGDRHPRDTGSVFGLLFAVGLLGGMSFPWALGQISQVWGVRAGMVLPLVGAIVLTAVALGQRASSTRAARIVADAG
jgi:fucose permease